MLHVYTSQLSLAAVGRIYENFAVLNAC